MNRDLYYQQYHIKDMDGKTIIVTSRKDPRIRHVIELDEPIMFNHVSVYKTFMILIGPYRIYTIRFVYNDVTSISCDDVDGCNDFLLAWTEDNGKYVYIPTETGTKVYRSHNYTYYGKLLSCEDA